MKYWKNNLYTGFTLVELIVVITIIWILWTIAFISLQEYPMLSRNAKRVSDIQTIESSLSLYQAARWIYPSPSDAFTVTYSGSTAWTQWSFWESAFNNIGNLSNIPVDPLTKNEYAYSITNTKKEYQLWAILEWWTFFSSATIWSQVYAWNTTALVEGIYNGKMIKLQTWNVDYILAVPTILTSEIQDVTIEEIIAREAFVMNGFTNIPGTYLENSASANARWYTGTRWFDYTPHNFVVYSWDTDALINETERETLAVNLQTAFIGSDLEQNREYKNFIDTTQENAAAVITNNIALNNGWISVPGITKTDVVNVNLSEKRSTALYAGNPDAFSTTWDTNNTSVWSSADNQIQLPLISSGNYNFTVDWWDGNSDTITTWNQPETTHTYANPGVYDISITGNIEGWSFNNTWDKLKLSEIINWWSIQFWNTWWAFYWAENMLISARDIPNLTGVTYMYNMFRWTHSLVDIPRINEWDVSNVTSMGRLFNYAYRFNGDVSDWDVSNVTNMYAMFCTAYDFNRDLNEWDVSQVTNMNSMFANCLGHEPMIFNGDVSDWDVTSAIDMKYMFKGLVNFNQDLNWDVSNVRDMWYMFNGTDAFNGDISNWDVSNVTNMQGMFSSADAFNQNLSNWTPSQTTNMWYMFSSADIFNSDLSSWWVNQVTNCSSFSTSSAYTLPIPNFTNCTP